MFNPERLSLIVQPIGEGGLRFYSYQTDDVEATVTGAGYATNAADYGLRTYDLIFVSPLDGAADTYILAVDTIDADGHATLASPGPIGDLLAVNNLSDVADAATALANLGGVSITADETITGAKTFSTPSSATTPVRLESSEAGAIGGPQLDLARTSASPAANDVIGLIRFRGMDSAATETSYGNINATILDPTDGSEDGRLILQVPVAGAQTSALSIANGIIVGAPTGSYQGTGTVNATAYYVNGVAVATTAADRTAIAALNTTTYASTFAYLNEAGREGLFKRVLAADYSALIAIDTAQGVFIASTHNAAYAWMRTGIKQHLDARWFGAKADGVYSAGYLTNGGYAGTDCTAAIQCMWNLAALMGKKSLLPAEFDGTGIGYKIARPTDLTDSGCLIMPAEGVDMEGGGTILIDHDPVGVYSLADLVRTPTYLASTDRKLYGAFKLSNIKFRGLHAQHPSSNTVHLFALSNCSLVAFHDVEAYDICGKFSRVVSCDQVWVWGGNYERIGSGVHVYRNCNNVRIIGVRGEWSGDDFVALHSVDPGIYPIASQHLVTGVQARNCGEMLCLGARSTIVTGNNLQGFGAGIYVGGAISSEGYNSASALIVKDNIVENAMGYWDQTTHAVLATNANWAYITVQGSPGTASNPTTGSQPTYFGYASGAVKSIIGLDTAGDFLIDNFGSGKTIPQGILIDVSHNTAIRTLPAVTNFSDYGWGDFWAPEAGAGVYDPAIADTNFIYNGISLMGEMIGAVIDGNKTHGHSLGASLFFRVIAGMEPKRAFRRIIVSNHIGLDCSWGVSTSYRSGTVAAPHYDWDISFNNCKFDCDPYHTSSQRKTGPIDGSWTAASASAAVSGFMLRNIVGWTINDGEVRNCNTPVSTVNGDTVDGVINRLTVVCDPINWNFDTGNKGVGYCGEGSTYQHRIEHCDPSDTANYGDLKNTCSRELQTVPTAGKYLPGHWIDKKRPAIAGGVVGWSRVTNPNSGGTNHTVGTDWLERAA